MKLINKLLAAAFACGFLVIIPAQGIRCDLVMKDDKCLEMTQTAVISSTIPANTTRIAEDGLNICLPSLSSSVPVDIVFILDQSGSMISSDAGYNTPKSMDTALVLLHQLVPASNVGFIGFANGICDGSRISTNRAEGEKGGLTPDTRVTPKPLTDNAHYDSLRWHADYNTNNHYMDCGSIGSSGTHYVPPLTLAASWLSAPSTREKVIIFITDGDPTDINGQNYITAFDDYIVGKDSTNFPEVYAVFIGGDHQPLTDFSEATGGTATTITNPSQIRGVVLDIVNTIVNSEKPIQTSVANQTNSASATAVTHTPYADDINRYNLVLENIVALNEGTNQVVIANMNDESALRQKPLSLSISGNAVTSTGRRSVDTLFDVICYDKTTLAATNQNGNPITSLPVTGSGTFGAELSTDSDIPLSNVKVTSGSDVESVPLDPGSKATGNITVTAPSSAGTAGNGKVEANLGESLQLEWTNPLDPRDFATSTLTIDDTVEASVHFEDMDGNRITNLSDFSGTEFKVVVTDNYISGPQTITLTSDDGDQETVALTQISNQRYEAVVPFQFKPEVTTGNNIIEGKLDAPSNNQTTVTADFGGNSGSLILNSGFVSPSYAEIKDGDADGRADTIKVYFNGDLPALPESITSIDWPAEGANNYTATQSEMSFGKNADGTPDKSVIIIVLDESKEFPENATGVSPDSLPYLTFMGVPVEIRDKAKPVVVEVEKHPSNFNRYMVVDGGDSTLMTQPDTLFIKLSEPIVFTADSAWKNMFRVTADDSTTFILPVVGKPVMLSDSLTWIVLIDNTPGANTAMRDDNITLNPAASVSDLQNNTGAERDVETDGSDGAKSGTANVFREQISGRPGREPTVILGQEQVPVFDGSGNALGTYSAEITLEDLWVPPVQMDNNGNINSSLSCSDNESEIQFPTGCLAALAVRTEETDGPYSASVQIFDHLGKFIRGWKQRFGYCGEFQNDARRIQSGIPGVFISDLVWNQRDKDKKLVGSGVYFWKVEITFKSGEQRELLKRMGVVRNKDMKSNCAAH